VAPDPEQSAQPHWHTVDAAPRTPPSGAASTPVPAILMAIGGIMLAVALGFLLSARWGSLTIAATLAVAGLWRATSPSGPAGLAIRTRGFDVFLCWTAAAAVGFLALTAPGV